MATLTSFLFSLVLLGFVLCEDEECSVGVMLGDNLKKLGRANNHLALNLYRKLTAVTDENIFISPFSISSVLTMLYSGARGETAQELRKLLGFRRAKLEDSVIFSTTYQYLTEILGKIDPNLYTLNCASALIVDSSYSLRSEYKKNVQEFYQAYVQEADFAADSEKIVEEMNTWVKIKSNGTIKSLADAIDPATALLLVSAAYFKGSWRLRFEPVDTKYGPFYNGGRILNRSDVPMMHTSASYRFYEEEDLTAVELAYEGKNISMLIFLPQEIDGINDMEQDMNPSKIAYIRKSMYHTKIHLMMPKFKLGFNRDLSEELKALGVTKVFGPGADLSGMISDDQVPILEEIRHKAMVEVNEQGSVAAAISTVMMTKMIPSINSVQKFHMDHPFLFVIVDIRSGLILFMGRVNKL